MNRMQSLFVYKGKKAESHDWIYYLDNRRDSNNQSSHGNMASAWPCIILGQGKLAANAEIGLRHPPCMGEILSHEQGNQPLRFKKSVGLSPNCSL